MIERRRLRKGPLVAYVVLALLTGYGLHANHEQGQAIQRERLHACQETNARNAATKAQLDKLVPAHATKAQRSGVAATRLLIDALAPVRDCDERAKQ